VTRKLPKNTYTQTLPYAALVGATAIWGVAGPVIKLTLQHVPVVSFLFLRLLIVCIVVLPFITLELQKDPVHKKDLRNFIILGILSQTFLLIIFAALNLTTAIDASLIGISFPMMALAAGYYFYKETVTPFEKLGVLIATIGALIVIVEPALGKLGFSEASLERIVGNVLALFYEITWLAYIIWSKAVMGENSAQVKKLTKFFHIKPMHKKYSPFIVTSLNFYVGLATLIPFFALEQLGFFGRVFMPPMLNLTAIAGILYMALLSSIVAYFLFQWGLENAEVSDVGFFRYLGPVFTFPAAYILLGEIPGRAVLIGLIFIIIGVAIAETHRS